MPRFFINYRSGDLVAKDDEGQDYPSLEQARSAALLSAREILADNIRSATPNALDAVIITNESGAEVMMISAKDVMPKSWK
ncbi:hypothetical protein LJR220_004909 [Bradyrhizobium sp. LjRoot220]|uniref:DUF6894 family protein n=1 Tax=Bradyrhizobium sp. LjRoot220 TaxID=3342284 RepID=UPI003ECF7547